jgi:hypothetical protein
VPDVVFSQDYNIPYGQQQQPQQNGSDYYDANGWFQDEYGEWYQVRERKVIQKVCSNIHASCTSQL